jgi:CxxC motif-containing protein (DUF1111 family)
LADSAGRAGNRANLLAELKRRAQMNLPHGANVQGLMLRYDIAVDGPAKVEQAVAAEIQGLPAAKPNRRKQQANDIKEHVGSVLEALPKPADRVTWLNQLCRAYPDTLRFQLGKEGKAAPEVLYGYLYAEMLKAVKATGATGRAESQRLASELETARVNFEKQAAKS